MEKRRLKAIFGFIMGLIMILCITGCAVEQGSTATGLAETTRQDTSAIKQTTIDEIVLDPAVQSRLDDKNYRWKEITYMKKCCCKTCRVPFDTEKEFLAHDPDHAKNGYFLGKVVVECINH